MHRFLQDLKKMLQESQGHRIDYYYLLTQMKSYDFFSEVIMSPIRLLTSFNRASLRKILNLRNKTTN